LQEAIDFKKNSRKTVYVVGEGIRDYLPALRSQGFLDLWNELEKEGSNSVKGVFLKIRHQLNPRGGNALLMFAYVDYVLSHTQADLMIFLNSKSGILANKEFGGPTYDEMVRVLQKFPKNFEHIHFVTGLFEVSPEAFEKQNKI
jgi:hypothetical protein